MAKLRIGTCSWKYPSWAGLVYSAEKGIDYLAEYARKYETVEVDQWFWSLFAGSGPRLPNPSDVEAYRRAVPNTFRFTVKVPNGITLTHFHAKSKAEPLVSNPHFLSDDLFAKFLASLEPLGETLGPLIFQFEYLNKQKMAGHAEFLERFADFLGRIPIGRDYALEIRNGSWLTRTHFEFVARHGLIPVLLQGYWMPQAVEIHRSHYPSLLRQRAVVVRLHSPDWKGLEMQRRQQWDRLVVRRDEELRGIVAMTKELLGAGVDVYLNVHNQYEGSAPLTIERIQALLAGTEPPGSEAEPGVPGDLTLPGMP